MNQSCEFVASHFVVAVADWLDEALRDLEGCPAHALMDDLVEPSEPTIAKAKNLLEAAARRVREQPDVYPLEEGSIALDFRHTERPWGVMLVVGSDGSGVSHHKIEKSRGRCSVDDAADLLKEGGWDLLGRSGVL